MTRTDAQHETELLPYYDARTDRIDANRYADDHGVNTVAAIYGPACGSDNEDTYLRALERNQATRKRGARARVRGIERAAWLRAVVSMMIAALAGMLAR